MRLPVKGFVRVFKDGELLASGHNTVVTSGLELLANRIFGTAGVTLPNKLQLGDDGRATTEDMTELQGTVKAEATATASLSGRVLVWTAEFTYDGATSFYLRELGLVNSQDTLLCRFLTDVLAQINPGAALKVQWQLTIGD